MLESKDNTPYAISHNATARFSDFGHIKIIKPAINASIAGITNVITTINLDVFKFYIFFHSARLLKRVTE